MRIGSAAAKRNSVGKVVGSNLGAGKIFLPGKYLLRITVSINNELYSINKRCLGSDQKLKNYVANKNRTDLTGKHPKTMERSEM